MNGLMKYLSASKKKCSYLDILDTWVEYFGKYSDMSLVLDYGQVNVNHVLTTRSHRP